MSKRRAQHWVKSDFVFSIALHIAGAAALVLGSNCISADSHLHNRPKNVIMLSAQAQAQYSKIPTRAAQKAIQKSTPTKQTQQSAEPKPVKKAKPKPAPKVKSEMALPKERTPDPEPPKNERAEQKAAEEEAEERKAEERKAAERQKMREDLLRKITREDLIKEQSNSPEGVKTRTASNPNGSKSGRGISDASNNPQLAAYIQACRARIIPNWTPIESLVKNNPSLSVQILVQINDDGTLSNPQITESSGDASFDRSAHLAILKTESLPLPPEKYRSAASANGILITLNASDKN